MCFLWKRVRKKQSVSNEENVVRRMVALALIVFFLATSLCGCFPLVYKDVDVRGQKRTTTYGVLFIPVYRAEEERGG